MTVSTSRTQCSSWQRLWIPHSNILDNRRWTVRSWSPARFIIYFFVHFSIRTIFLRFVHDYQFKIQYLNAIVSRVWILYNIIFRVTHVPGCIHVICVFLYLCGYDNITCNFISYYNCYKTQPINYWIHSYNILHVKL